MIGIGPIRITAPPLVFPKFGNDPRASRSMPMKMAANAIRNKRPGKPNVKGCR